MRLSTLINSLVLSLSFACSLAWAAGDGVTDPKLADADFAIQGEYVGDVKGKDAAVTWGAQVIALGKGKFHIVGYPGGLPGDGWNQKDKKEIDGQTDAGATVFKNENVIITLKDGAAAVADPSGNPLGTLKKVMRKSPTMNAPAPEGAVVLFDGKSADQWEGGMLTEDGLLMQGVTSKRKFQSFSGHVEFVLPYMPEARGQGRGNSGCYFQGRYEVQMLDSFGLKGENNECGGIYTIASPRVNMCYPPLSWQTYDFDYTAAGYEGDKKIKNATLTVKHNGVVIHENVDLTHSTTASPLKEGPEPGPLFLQNHGNPVRYRNIWVVEKK